MKKEKISIGISLITILFLVVSMNFNSSYAIINKENDACIVDYGICSLSFNPKPLVSGENMTVIVNFYDTTNVSLVKLLICQLSPEFKCEPVPTLMNEEYNETFVGKFLVYYKSGVSVGFHIQIVYINGSSLLIPDRANFLDFKTAEPITGEFYFDAGIVMKSTEKTSGILIITAVLSLMVTTIWIKRKKTNANLT